MTRTKLKNKPLVEAILEVKWSVPASSAAAPDVTNISGDPHYRLLLGRFSERVQDQYPSHEPLPAAQIPDGLIPHVAQHRFRTNEGGWPLVQIGNGVMTVNDTQAYTWSDFRKRCEYSFKKLYESHPSRDDFHVQELALVYIDAIDVDFTQDDVFAFLFGKMKTTVSLPDNLFDGGHVTKSPSHFQWESGFKTTKPTGHISLKFGMGRSGSTPALILETRVFSQADDLPALPDGISNWLVSAHDLAGDWFFKLIEGDLLEKFS